MKKARYCFLTSGYGIHSEKLISFELALRHAGVAPYNWVFVNSILPPFCTIVDKTQGIALLKQQGLGSVAYAVMSRAQSETPGESVISNIAIAQHKNKPNAFGYISEHSTACDLLRLDGKKAKLYQQYTEDLAAYMLCTLTDEGADVSWENRRALFDSMALQCTSISETSHVLAPHLWHTVVSLAVLV